MEWARGRIQPFVSDERQLTRSVSLGSSAPLALAYEKSCVVSRFFSAQALPGDDEIRGELLRFAGLLRTLYESERLGVTPLSVSPEVRDAIEAAAEISSPARSGQGFSLTGPERKAVELHAMELATKHLESLGYRVKDVSLKESYDLLAAMEDVLIKVEVKGTTGLLGSIVLTRNEVDLHRVAHPCNALVVVHSIELETKNDVPKARGGLVRCWLPWSLEEERLKPLSYSYELS